MASLELLLFCLGVLIVCFFDIASSPTFALLTTGSAMLLSPQALFCLLVVVVPVPPKAIRLVVALSGGCGLRGRNTGNRDANRDQERLFRVIAIAIAAITAIVLNTSNNSHNSNSHSTSTNLRTIATSHATAEIEETNSS